MREKRTQHDRHPKRQAAGEDDAMTICSEGDAVDCLVSANAETTEVFTRIDMTKTIDTAGECACSVGRGGRGCTRGWGRAMTDTWSAQHVSHDSRKMTEYGECRDRIPRGAGGSTHPIIGGGELTLAFRSDGRSVVPHVSRILTKYRESVNISSCH